MNSYTYTFPTRKSPQEVFDLLLDVERWWSGIYEETITGKSEKLNDEFSFSAGGGIHFSKQKLVELIPGKKIVWQITESNHLFLNNPKEWENTRLVFDILDKENETQVTFTHEGLEPQIECYDECSHAWTQYLNNLPKKLKEQ
jgi:hypothetical protein